MTRTVSPVALCPLSIQVQLGSRAPSAPEALRAPGPVTVTAFKTGERVTGMTKQCVYEGLGNAYTMTIRSVELCPLNLQVRSSRKTDSPGAQRAPLAPCDRHARPVTSTLRGDFPVRFSRLCTGVCSAAAHG